MNLQNAYIVRVRIVRKRVLTLNRKELKKKVFRPTGRRHGRRRGRMRMPARLRNLASTSSQPTLQHHTTPHHTTPHTQTGLDCRTASRHPFYLCCQAHVYLGMLRCMQFHSPRLSKVRLGVRRGSDRLLSGLPTMRGRL